MAQKKKKTAKKKTAKKMTKKKTAKKKTSKKTTKKTTKKKKKASKTAAGAKVTSRRKPDGPRPLKKSPLSKDQLEHFRELLLEKRRELIGDVNSMEDEALRKSRLDATGDLSSMPIHMADIGTDNYEQEFALGLMNSERKLLKEIDEALDRIDLGVYGICEGTGQAIPLKRLEANPWARYCVQYAEMVEKGIVAEGEKTYDEEDYEDQDRDQSDEDEGPDSEESDSLDSDEDEEDLDDDDYYSDFFNEDED